MSNGDEKMVHIQVTPATRETIGLLKRKYKVRRLTDVLIVLLQEHESELYKKGAQLADLKESLEQINKDESEEE